MRGGLHFITKVQGIFFKSYKIKYSMKSSCCTDDAGKKLLFF